MKSYKIDVAILIVLALGSFRLLSEAIMGGNLFVAILAAPILSIFMMWVFRALPEGNKAKQEGMPHILDPRTQSWMFLFGDFIGLTMMFVGAALAWPEVDGFWRGGLWFIITAVLGFVGMYAWRTWQVIDYSRVNESERLYGPTKLWHDYFVYGCFLPLTILLCLPVVATWSTPGAYYCIGGLAFWLSMGLCDAFRGLKASNLHVVWGKTEH